MKRSLVAVLALLAGCAVAPSASKESSTLSDIVGETVAATKAAAPERNRLLASAERRHAAEPGDATAVRLAALLILLPEPLRDDGRAQGLLAPLVARNSPGPLTHFAALLAEQAAERQRLRREHEEAHHDAQQREAALREQIEALKAIERGILEREERFRARRR
jgi:hypothetical protein